MSLTTNGLEDWVVPDTGDAAAQRISVAAGGVGDIIDRASTKWNGLSGSYQTEQTADVLAAFASIQPHAAEVVRVADAGKAALETFAETVRDLIKRRTTVLGAAATFANSKFTDAQGEPDDNAKAAEESRIQGLVNALVGDYIAAQQDCFNTLSGIVPELRDEFKLINGAEGGLVAGVVTGVLDEHIHRSPYPVPTGWRSVPPPDTFASLPFDHIDPNTGIRWNDDGTGKLVMVGTSTDPNIDRLNPRRVPTGFHQPTSLRLNTPDPLNPTRGINNVPGWAKGGGAALSVAEGPGRAPGTSSWAGWMRTGFPPSSLRGLGGPDVAGSVDPRPDRADAVQQTLGGWPRSGRLEWGIGGILPVLGRALVQVEHGDRTDRLSEPLAQCRRGWAFQVRYREHGRAVPSCADGDGLVGNCRCRPPGSHRVMPGGQKSVGCRAGTVSGVVGPAAGAGPSVGGAAVRTRRWAAPPDSA